MKSSPMESELISVHANPNTLKAKKNTTITNTSSHRNTITRKAMTARSMSPSRTPVRCFTSPGRMGSMGSPLKTMMIVERPETMQMRMEALRINMIRMNSFKLPSPQGKLDNVPIINKGELLRAVPRIGRPSRGGAAPATRGRSSSPKRSTKSKRTAPPPPPPPPPPPSTPPSAAAADNKGKRREASSSKEVKRKDSTIASTTTKTRSRSTPAPASSTTTTTTSSSKRTTKKAEPLPVSTKHKTRIQQGLVPKPPPPPPSGPVSGGKSSSPSLSSPPSEKPRKLKKKIVIRRDDSTTPTSSSPAAAAATRIGSPPIKSKRAMKKSVSADDSEPRKEMRKKLVKSNSMRSERTLAMDNRSAATASGDKPKLSRGNSMVLGRSSSMRGGLLSSSRGDSSSLRGERTTSSLRGERTTSSLRGERTVAVDGGTTGGNAKQKKRITPPPPPPPPPPSSAPPQSRERPNALGEMKKNGLMTSMRKKLAKSTGKKGKSMSSTEPVTDIM